MKFDMGSTTLSHLVKESDGSFQDLGSLVKRLIAAAEPLEGTFNGNGRVAFDSFKARTDEVAAELTVSLAAIIGGQADMDVAFVTGDEESADNSTQAMGSSNFDGARFASIA
ncbi:MAG: hypothetical protein ACRCTR_08110 [Actinomycetota bacterium]